MSSRRLVGSLLIALAICACGAASTALPPDSAPPAAVLDAYLRALLVGDCRTGRELVTASFTKGNGELCGDVRVTAFSISGDPATPTSDEAVFGTSLTTMGSADGSVRAGQTIWFYDLKRQPDGRWRIVGGGSGP